MKLDDISNLLHEITDGIDTVSNAKHSAMNIANNISENSQYSKTDQYKNDFLKSIKIETKSRRLLKFSLLLWTLMIVITIILCIIGNDIILRFLHI